MKEKITEVALQQFLQHGIRNMTLKKLVEPMRVSTKTVYKFFSSKDELLEECLRLLYTGYHNEFVEILNIEDNPVNKLLIFFRATVSKDFGVSHAFFHDLNYYYSEFQNAAIDRISNSYGRLLTLVVQKGITDGYFHRFIVPGVALKGIRLLYTSITRSEDYKDHECNPYELFKNLVEIYIRGMCTEKGLKEIQNNPNHNE